MELYNTKMRANFIQANNALCSYKEKPKLIIANLKKMPAKVGYKGTSNPGKLSALQTTSQFYSPGEIVRSIMSSDASIPSLKCRAAKPFLKTPTLSFNNYDMAEIIKMAQRDDSIINDNEQPTSPVYKFPNRPVLTPTKIFLQSTTPRVIKKQYIKIHMPLVNAFPSRPAIYYRHKNLRLIWQDNKIKEMGIPFSLRRNSARFIRNI